MDFKVPPLIVSPGATALLPAISEEIRDLGWYFIPVVLLSSVLAFSVALLNNNIQRRYPTFWFKAHSPAVPAPTTSPVDPPAESSRGITGENMFVVDVKPLKPDASSVA